MAFEDIKTVFTKNAAELEPVVKNALNQLLQKEVQISKDIKTVQNVSEALGNEKFPSVILSFTSGQENNNRQHLFLFEPSFLMRFYAWMIADEPAEELNDEHFEGLKEAFQQVFGQIKVAVPDDQASFVIDDPQVGLIDNGGQLDEIVSDKPGVHTSLEFSVEDSVSKVSYYYWAINEIPANAEMQTEAQGIDTVTVQPAEFDPLSGNDVGSGAPRNVDMLLDVNLEITVELDRKVMMVSELLKLGKGSIVELEKSAGEPLDIFINGRKFAEGEVVVIDDKFGIRITQLLSPKERLKSLGQ